MDDSYGSKTAREIIQKYDTNDVYELCQLLQIQVSEAPLRQLNGVIKHDSDGTFIVVNSMLPSFIKRFVIAHELGHFVLHPHDIGFFWILHKTNFRMERLERDADCFAIKMLGLSEEFYAQIKDYVRIKEGDECEDGPCEMNLRCGANGFYSD